MKEFMFENLYHHPRVMAEREKMRTIIKQLFEYYMEHLDALPPNFQPPEESLEARVQAVCDYIAGMTDRYAIQRYIQHFLPRNWGG